MIDSRDVVIRTYYSYFEPSVAAAAVMCALFSIGCIVSIYQTIRHRAWIWFIMIVCIGMEAVGYGARIASAADVSARTVYIVQFCLIILAPVIMAGIIYVVFGRIVFLVVPAEFRTIKTLWVPARWLTPIFVGFDIFALFLQLIGAVMLSSTQATDADALTKINNGKNLATAGVYLQLAAFGLFSFIAIRFHFVSRRFIGTNQRQVRVNASDKSATQSGSDRGFNPKWERLLYAVNISCALILIRSIYREVDFSMGRGSALAQHEYISYILDALPMLIVVLLFNLFPPGAYVSMGWRQPKQETERMMLHSSDDAYHPNTLQMTPHGHQQV